jgi:hypothetical protein
MIHGYSMQITERFSTIVAYKWYILVNSTPMTFHSLYAVSFMIEPIF